MLVYRLIAFRSKLSVSAGTRKAGKKFSGFPENRKTEKWPPRIFFLTTNDLQFDFVSFPGEQFRSSSETKLSKAMVQLASGVQPVAGVLEPVVGEQSEEGV